MSKRPASGPDTGSTSRQVKRIRTNDSRTILSQTSEKALSSNGDLDVGSFIKSREFEIRALENAMAVSKKESSLRAFQQIPRDLRRRTASHNVKRVPKRLRSRAAKEMLLDNTPPAQSKKKEKTARQHLRAQNAKKLPNLAKRIEQQKEKEERKLAQAVKKSTNQLAEAKPKFLKYKKRQINKFWLPTHVWHAKRARMSPPLGPLWRFCIPLTPTEKTARVTGRASRLRGCIAWDTSYISTISVTGAEDSIIKILRALSVPERLLSGQIGDRWRSGARSCQSWARRSSNSAMLIAPITMIWQPQGEISAERQVWIRVHPSAFGQVWGEFLALGKSQHSPVKIGDLRSAIASIEITGPAALESLTGVLHQAQSADQAETKSLWKNFAPIQDSYLVPTGAMVSILATDPRLGQPHQTVSRDKLAMNEDTLILGTTFPAIETDKQRLIFDFSCRRKAVRSLQTQSAINKRKAASPPGQKPEPLLNDPQIPVMLLANNYNKKSQATGSWTVIMPPEFILPTWHSLMHYPISTGGNPRFGGLDEERQLCFEAGRPWFPGDFPGTEAGWQWEVDQRAKRKAEWDGKPRSRRVEWKTLDVGTGVKGELGLGWTCDWQYLCGDLIKTVESSVEEPHSADNQALPAHICQIITPTIDAPETFPTNGLTAVCVTLVGKGRPSSCARIYRLPTDNPVLRQSWLEQLEPKEKASLFERSPNGPSPTEEAIPETQPTAHPDASGSVDNANPNHPVVPSAKDLVGFITTGNFNLAQGRGSGIGCIVWTRVVNEVKRNKNGGLHGLCIVRDAGQTIGRLAAWESVS